MPKKLRVRTLMDSQDIEASEGFLKSSLFLSYFLSTLKGYQLEKFCFSSI